MIRKHRVLIVLAMSLFVAGGWWFGYYQQQSGRVSLDFQLSDQRDLSLTLNGHPLIGYSATDSITLRSGFYKLSAEKPGYKDFLVGFRVSKGQSLVLNIKMQPRKSPSLKTASSALKADLSSSLTGDFTVQHITYFYDNTWAAATVTASDGNTALIVASYDATNNSWRVELGPGTSFDESDLGGMPSEITSFLSDQGYVNQGVSDE